MASYIILGAGKFGRLAVKRLLEQDPAAHFVIVDQSPVALEAVPSCPDAQVAKIETEVTAFLKEYLPAFASWDWLIPMVPVHVALACLPQGPPASEGWECMAVPEVVENLAYAARRGASGELYLSRAAHLCPDDCPAPEDVCPVSGESRTPALYEDLAALTLPGFQVRVISCRQLAPGVGGYPPRELLDLADAVAAAQENLLIVTACRCHGVAHAVRRQGGKV